MVNTESFYGGTVYPLDPAYGSPIAYAQTFAELGTSVDARTANQIKEVSEHLNTGIKTIEVAGHDPSVFEAIPKEHLKELNRISKLTGSDLTFHAPMIDPSGISQHGWEQMNQDAAAEQLWSAIKRSHDLDPKGNISVTMHASTAQLPAAEFKTKGPHGEEIKSVILITPQGRLHQVKEEPRYFPRGGEWKPGKPVPFEPEKAISEENKRYWSQQLDNLNYASSFASKNIRDSTAVQAEAEREIKAAEQITGGITEEQKAAVRAQAAESAEQALSHGGIYIRNAYNNLKEMFDLAYPNSSGEDRKKLDEFAKEIAPQIKNFEAVTRDPKELRNFSKTVENGVKLLGQVENPQILKPLREFAIQKSAETTANLALKGYKKFGDSAPIIALENHPAQQSLLTTGKDLRDTIKEARRQFVKKAVREEGVSESEAEEQAEKLIGATWDVGHINMLRRYGYDKSDIVKETKAVAPYVKKVHLSDNFGFEHTELPMGMGNVPMKEIMKQLGKEGFSGKKVVEALSWWQHFSPGGKTNPAIIPTLHGMGAPIYSGQEAPMWNQHMGAAGGYFGGYGTINPEIHHSLYGAGFSSLPQELGGQIQGKDTQAMTGTPMA